MTKRKFFGTDGIRGTANKFPMKAEIALSLGRAAGHYFTRGKDRHRVVIAKDTRLSGYMVENALTAGFLAAGMDVILVGPMPTPAVAMLTRSMRADLGVMISASHNPFHDNGLKLFGPDGYKLSDESELEIESLMENFGDEHLADPDKIGRARRIEDARGRYIEFAKASFPSDLRLDGMRIVIDCANGAAYKVAPIVLEELGAEVIAIGVEPNGFNVNKECGSTHPEKMCEKVRIHRADIGIALDGDADRLILCDEKAALVDGDQILAMIATHWKNSKKLSKPCIVATQMSNLGLENYCDSIGIELKRTDVGDRYVVQEMRDSGCNLGGEQSGHVVMSDYATTGDGLIASLQVLAAVKRLGKPASEALRVFEPLPQTLKNVRYETIDPLESTAIQQEIEKASEELAETGRLFIRKSGTEPLIRIMAESSNDELMHRVTDHLKAKIAAQIAKDAA